MSESGEIESGDRLKTVDEKLESIEKCSREILKKLEHLTLKEWESWNKGVLLTVFTMLAAVGFGTMATGLGMLWSGNEDGRYLVTIGYAPIIVGVGYVWVKSREMQKWKRD